MSEPPVVPKTRKSKMLLRTLVVFCLMVCLGAVCVGIWFGYQAYMTAAVRKPNAYAMESAGLLVLHHMQAHSGSWPAGWEDLVVASAQSSHGYFSTNANEEIEEIRNRVEIDWNAQPERLLSLVENGQSIENRLIRLRSGRHDWFHGGEPNQMVLDYLIAMTGNGVGSGKRTHGMSNAVPPIGEK